MIKIIIGNLIGMWIFSMIVISATISFAENNQSEDSKKVSLLEKFFLVITAPISLGMVLSDHMHKNYPDKDGSDR